MRYTNIQRTFHVILRNILGWGWEGEGNGIKGELQNKKILHFYIFTSQTAAPLLEYFSIITRILAQG